MFKSLRHKSLQIYYSKIVRVWPDAVYSGKTQCRCLKHNAAAQQTTPLNTQRCCLKRNTAQNRTPLADTRHRHPKPINHYTAEAPPTNSPTHTSHLTYCQDLNLSYSAQISKSSTNESPTPCHRINNEPRPCP